MMIVSQFQRRTARVNLHSNKKLWILSQILQIQAQYLRNIYGILYIHNIYDNMYSVCNIYRNIYVISFFTISTTISTLFCNIYDIIYNNIYRICNIHDNIYTTFVTIQYPQPYLQLACNIYGIIYDLIIHRTMSTAISTTISTIILSPIQYPRFLQYSRQYP